MFELCVDCDLRLHRGAHELSSSRSAAAGGHTDIALITLTMRTRSKRRARHFSRPGRRRLVSTFASSNSTTNWRNCRATMPNCAAPCCWRSSTARQPCQRSSTCCSAQAATRTWRAAAWLRLLDTADYLNAAEMKRLYVRPASAAWGRQPPVEACSMRHAGRATPVCCWTRWTTWRPHARSMKSWGSRRSRTITTRL